jgi:hypothetical protein
VSLEPGGVKDNGALPSGDNGEFISSSDSIGDATLNGFSPLLDIVGMVVIADGALLGELVVMDGDVPLFSMGQ